jgi:hypothetical protein
MYWEPINTSSREARKTHRCVWCWGDILPRTFYVRDFGNAEGDLQVNKYHPECWDAGVRNPEIWADGFEPGSFKRGTAEER